MRSKVSRIVLGAIGRDTLVGAIQSMLCRPVSDHFSILLIWRGPTPFCFEVMWPRADDFKDLLRSWWQSLNFNGSFNYVSAAKLKALMAILKSWNMDAFGNVEVNKSRALQRIGCWDELENDRPLFLEEFEKSNLAREDFKYWSMSTNSSSSSMSPSS